MVNYCNQELRFLGLAESIYYLRYLIKVNNFKQLLLLGLKRQKLVGQFILSSFTIYFLFFYLYFLVLYVHENLWYAFSSFVPIPLVSLTCNGGAQTKYTKIDQLSILGFLSYLTIV